MRVLLALALTGVAALAAAPAVAVPPDTVRKPQKKRVEVVDNYYSPRKLTVNLKSRINWVWTDGSAGYTYSKTLTKPGVYKFICTLHVEDNMRMTITVRH